MTVLADEGRELRDGDVALLLGAAADLLEVLREWQPAVAVLDHRPEDDDLERLQPQVRDEARAGPDRAVELPVVRQLVEHLDHARCHRRVGRRVAHRASPPVSWSATVTATTTSPSRRVRTARLRPPAATATRPVARSSAVTMID